MSCIGVTELCNNNHKTNESTSPVRWFSWCRAPEGGSVLSAANTKHGTQR